VDAAEPAERAAADEQEGEAPIDQAGPGIARRRGQREGGDRGQRGADRRALAEGAGDAGVVTHDAKK